MSEHPALSAAREAMAAVSAGDRTAWLDRYDDDAVLEDPVGGSPLDPEGVGLRGRTALEGFWDLVVGPNDFDFEITATHSGGSEAALSATVRGRYPNGAKTSYDGIFIYTIGENGKITSVRAFWDIDAVMSALGAS